MCNCCINNHFNDSKLWYHLGQQKREETMISHFITHICLSYALFYFCLVIYEIPHDCAHIIIFFKCLFVLILFFPPCNASVIILLYSILHVLKLKKICYYEALYINILPFLDEHIINSMRFFTNYHSIHNVQSSLCSLDHL